MRSERLLRLRFPAEPGRLRAVRELARSSLERVGLKGECADQVIIALNEACMNVIQHAYKGDPSGEIVLEILNNGDELEVLLTDFAEPVDPASFKPRNLEELRPGGLGTHFIHECMDDWALGHLDGECGNVLRMRKKIQ